MAEDIETIEGIDEEAAESSQPGKLSQLAGTSLNSIRGGWKKAASGAATLINKVKRAPLKTPLLGFGRIFCRGMRFGTKSLAQNTKK